MVKGGRHARAMTALMIIIGTLYVASSDAHCQTTTLLPDGYLSTRGSQIVDASGVPQRIAAIGWAGGDNDSFVPDGLYAVNYRSTMQRMVQAGFNTIRLPYCDTWVTDPDAHPPAAAISNILNPDLRGLTALQVLDRVIAEAGTLRLKVIIDHHGNDCRGGQQANGLWYTRHVSVEQFENNWLLLARRYKDDGTVIGYDLDNEVHEPATWGDGGSKDWAAEATRLGDMLLAIDPQPLIIVEGVITWNPEQRMPQPSCMTNLEAVRTNPLHLNVPDKLVYSVHEYPPGVSNCRWNNSASPQYDLPRKWNTDWGFVQTKGIAPVWIGEAGSSLLTQVDRNWAAMLVAYINGELADQGGPRVQGDTPGVSWCWWAWTHDNPQTDPDGFLERNWYTFKPDQLALVRQIMPKAR